MWKVVGSIFAFIVFVLVINTIFAAYDLGWYAVQQPAIVAIQTNTFEHSQAYNDGMAKDLANFRLNYPGYTPDQQQTVRATIKERYAGYNTQYLSSEDKAFLEEILSSPN